MKNTEIMTGSFFHLMNNAPAETKEKHIDYELLFLQTFCIFCVLNGHYLCVKTIFSNYFPYYSWHMPFYIFISGILFARTASKRNFLQFLRHKCQTLLLPALTINFFYGIISWFMRRYQFVFYGEDISLKTVFISPFLTNHQFDNDASLWFIFQLFILEMIVKPLFSFRDHIQIKTSVKDVICLIAAFLISAYTMVSSMNISNKTPELTFLLRTGFLLFFFSAGIFYEQHLTHFLKTFKSAIIGCCLAITGQILLLHYVEQNDMIMYVQNMNTLTIPNFLIPYLTFTAAALLLLCTARCIFPILQKNKILDCVGFDLRYVVYHHQFCAIFISLLFFILYCSGKKELVPRFDPVSYRIHPFYIYYFSQNFFIKLLYFGALFLIPLYTAKIINRNKNRKGRFSLWMVLFLTVIIIITITGRYYQDALRNIR